MRKSLIRLGVILMLVLAATAAETQTDICMGCISIRIGRPIIIRGPSGPQGDEIDAALSVMRLPNGKYRGFTSNVTTFAIDGDAPWDMGGPKRPVLGPGAKGSASECGNWITSVVPHAGKLIGLIHNEQACSYRDNQTHKSMSVGLSTDMGLSWTVLGPIISGTDTPQKGKGSGEGDCTGVDGNDGYLYAYCLRVADWATIAARAPLSDPSRFTKWGGASWNVPGLGGTGAPLAGAPGSSAAYWKTAKAFVLLSTRGSIGLSLSTDGVRFAPLAEPFLNYDSDSWKRPGPTDLYGYPSLIGETGFNQLSDHFFLTYMYLPPSADFDQRYIVLHDVSIAMTRRPVSPQVGVALSRWRKPDGAFWTTTGPTIEDRNRLAYTFDRTLGYLMTTQPATPSLRLAECAGSAASDYVLSEDGFCAREGFRRLRTAGFLYRERQPDTVPLYRCVASRGIFHFGSRDPDCEGLGTSERLLGYMLEK